MGYTAKAARTIRTTKGTLTEKIAAETVEIQDAFDQIQVAFDHTERLVKLPLAGGAADAMALVWQNPEPTGIMLTRAILDIETAGGTATAVLDGGVVNAATDTAENVFKDVDANATGITESALVPFKMTAKDGNLDHFTIKILTEKAEALEGGVYLWYTPVV